jgi:hypothetical protein
MFPDLIRTNYYVISTPELILGIKDGELGECLLAWSKRYNAELYLNEILPLTDIKTQFAVIKVRYGDMVLTAMESKVGIIIDELPDDRWLDYVDVKKWLSDYPLDMNSIQWLMEKEFKNEVSI